MKDSTRRRLFLGYAAFALVDWSGYLLGCVVERPNTTADRSDSDTVSPP